MHRPTHRWSLFAVLATASVLLWTRVEYSELRQWAAVKVTTWDAFAYYAYLPGVFIHDDIAHMPWAEDIDARYHVFGGPQYQFLEAPGGNRVDKCLYGTALFELPFFLVGHLIANSCGYLADGFSAPYQWCIALAPLFYCTIALLLLRGLLLRWVSDATAAITLILLVLATNAIQYISVDGAQTHGFLFALYAAQLWFTAKWHDQPRKRWAIAIGACVGLAAVTRPTEVIMFFIPLLWRANGWSVGEKLRMFRGHFILAVVAAAVMALPQLVYWKFVTGSWVFDVGSKWSFLSPHFRVLFGWEKGWFIYTPIAIFFIVGLFFMRGKPWARSVLVFTLLNLWIITAWHDWRYGGSYSTRALVQSYPVLSLPFALLVERVRISRLRWPAAPLALYLLGGNLFQIKQYNLTVLHYDQMNRDYYRAIYMDAHPTPLDFSLLDTRERPDDVAALIELRYWESDTLPEGCTAVDISVPGGAKWVLVEAEVQLVGDGAPGRIGLRGTASDTLRTSVRLGRPLVRADAINSYAFFAPMLPGEHPLTVALQQVSDPENRLVSASARFYR